MKTIICNLNLFAQYHTIGIHDGETMEVVAVVDNDHLAPTIVTACYDKGINNVHLFGIKEFLVPIAEEIISLNELNYSTTNEIIVEVN